MKDLGWEMKNVGWSMKDIGWMMNYAADDDDNDEYNDHGDEGCILYETWRM